MIYCVNLVIPKNITHDETTLHPFNDNRDVSCSGSRIDLGIKVGLNYVNVSGIDDFNQRQGISAGLFAGARLGDKLGFQIDALYSQQGAEVDQSISQVISEFNLDYISIPIVLKYYLTESVNIHAGPQLGILLNEETNVFNQTINSVEANTADWLGNS